MAKYINLYRCNKCGSIMENAVSCTATYSVDLSCKSIIEPTTMIGKKRKRYGFYKKCNGVMEYFDAYEPNVTHA
jgi:hypothetical protein